MAGLGKVSYAVLLLCGQVSANENSQNVFFNLHSYTYSEPTPIDSFVNKFEQGVSSGDHALTQNLIELGVAKNNFSLSVFRRLDYLFTFSNDTARLYANTENDKKFVSQEMYQLALKIHHIDMAGLKLAYQKQVSESLTLAAAFSYLDAKEFQQGKLYGDAVWNGPDDYQINAPATLYADENKLLSIPNTEATGEGFSTDIAIDWKINQSFELALKVTDLWGKVYWQDALYHQINRWQVYREDENGQLDTSPVLQGRIQKYQQKLPAKWAGKFTYSLNDTVKFYQQTLYSSYYNHQLWGAEYHLNQATYFSLAWHQQAQALEIGAAFKYGYLRLMTDSFNQEKNHALSLSTGFNIPF